MATLQIGQRVVRSDMWTWPDQDGGCGHVGTVVSLPGRSILEGLGSVPHGWVRVRWDVGNGNNYRAGGSEKYDLLLLDNAPAGVVHSTIVCDHCKEDPIAGIRWKCSHESCPDYDLCTKCYMANEHDVTHTFIRFASPNETGIQVGPRVVEESRLAKGIFPGATVKRGKDWQGGNSDGGPGEEGKVVEITNHSGVPRSAALVQWGSTKSTSKHQVGCNGKMELSVVKSGAPGPTFYPRHLPHLGKGVCLKVGDFVAVTLDTEALEAMQVASGLQWTAEMKGVFGKVTKISKVDSHGNVHVVYGSNKSFVFHPEVLSKIPNLGKGDRVRVLPDLTYVKNLQDRSMNGWVDGMEKCVGLQGEVSGVDIHKNARVKLVGIMNELSWHPCTLEILKKISPDAPASDILPGLDDAEVFTKALMSLLGIHADDESHSSSSPSSDDSGDKKDEEFMEVAKAGKVERVVEIITESPDRVNHKVNGKTALHRAAVQGHIDVVMALVEAGADVNATDSSGNTPVMFAAEGDEPAVVKYLVGKGADVNQGNKNGRRAAHLAAYKGLADCMRILINSGCDVNLQDDDGDTAIHDAVNKGGVDVVELLLDSRELDLTLTNKRGLTPLQFAAFLDRPSEAELIVKAFPKSIIIPREDGNTVLHIAAVNNHAAVIKKILAVQDHGLCLDSKNEDALTALHLACAKGQTQCIELLVAEGADINCQGKDDQGALHLVALSSRSEEDVEVKDTPTIQKIRQTYQKHGCKDAASALLVFMVKHGASVTLENMKCRTPLSYVKDQQLRATLKKIARGESVSDDGVDMSTWEDLGEDEDVKTGRLGGDPVDEVENNIVDDAQTAGRTRRRSERVSEEEPKETGSASKTTGSGLAGTSSPGVKVFDLVHQVGAQELDLGDVIGSGQFGTVYRAVWHGTPVAVKKISFLGSKQSEVEKEVAIHRRASHPNIVQMMALGYEGSHAYLVMQLIDGNALADILFPTKSGQKKMSLSSKEKLQISRGILQAVSYMHACNILHLDIKPANILIETLTKRPYICDLGLAHIKNRNAMSQSSVKIRGTPCYMPPETLSPTPDAKHSNKHDVWSVAGTLVELHSGQRLWGEGPIHPLAFLAQMMTGIGGTPQALAKVESSIRRILEPCFKRDPDQRPSAQQLLEKFNALT